MSVEFMGQVQLGINNNSTCKVLFCDFVEITFVVDLDCCFTHPPQHTHYLGYLNTYPLFFGLCDQVVSEYRRLLRGMYVRPMISVHEK
jgi:hypothetical protein